MSRTRVLTPEEHQDALHLTRMLRQLLRDNNLIQSGPLATLDSLASAVQSVLERRSVPALGQGYLSQGEGYGLAAVIDALGKMLRTGPGFTEEQVEQLVTDSDGRALVRTEEPFVGQLIHLNDRLVQLYPDAPRLQENREEYAAPGVSVFDLKQS